MSQATSGYSTKFQTDASGSFATIAEVVNIKGPGPNTKTIDVSNMDSAQAVEEFIMGMTNPGQVSLTLNYLPQNATQKQVFTDQIARTKRNFKIIFPDPANSVWAFAGFYTHHEPDAPHDGKLSLAVTINVTGVITYP